MNLLKDLENNSILIIPNQIKESVLEYLNNEEFKNVKILTFSDLKRGLFFNYDLRATYFLMNKYNFSYEIASDYIKNLYYISPSSNSKIQFLSDMKKTLDDNNLLIYDKLFISLLKSKNALYVYGFDYLDKYQEYLLSIASKYIKVINIEKEYNSFSHEVLVFNQIEEEIIFVAEKICELIKNGVSLNNIYIANYNKEYEFVLKRIFGIYNIGYYLQSDNRLYMTNIVKYFVDNLDSDIQKSLFKLEKRFDIKNNEANATIYNRLIKVLNDFYWCDNLLNAKDLLISKLKNTTISDVHYKNEVTFIDIVNNEFTDKDYVFLINFNMGQIPKIKRDEDYINDDIKPSFLDKSYELNFKVSSALKKEIKNIKNLVITAKKNTPFDSYEVATFIDDIPVINKSIDFAKYSDKINKYLLANATDEYIKYGLLKDNLKNLYNSYDSSYQNYSNAYKAIENSKLIENISGCINFSYSNISDYYKCPFKFYVSNILKIKDYKTTLATYIGSLFHYVLEKCVKNEMDIDSAYEKYLNEFSYEASNKEKFFISEVKKELYFIINNIKKHMTLSSYKEIITEKNIEISYEGKIKSVIKGFIDKMLKNGSDYVIVDYKTGNVDVKKEYFEYGLYIQLPIYLYLVKNFDKDANIVGIYLQHILNSKPAFDQNKPSLLINENKLKLEGLTLSDLSKVKDFDQTYEKSNFIKGISTNKNGELKQTSGLITYEEGEEIYKITEKLIYECIHNVEVGMFDIKPIYVENIANGCTYCPYKDICFKRPNDINRKDVIIKNKEEGDSDGLN